jgi:hypothetical protein
MGAGMGATVPIGVGPLRCETMSFSTEDVELLAAANEVLIETEAGDHVYQTVIWVVEGGGSLYVRSFVGDSGRWYQRALTNPRVALVAGDTRVVFQAVPADDDESVRQASEGFLEKYPAGRSLDAMLLPEVLHTTLRLDPVS